MPNLAALRAAIFLLSAKNRWGGGTYVPPPPGRARVNHLFQLLWVPVLVSTYNGRYINSDGLMCWEIRSHNMPF